MKISSLVLTLCAIALNPVSAGPIIQPVGSGAWNVTSLGPIGQTFTAEDPYISTVGFDFSFSQTADLTYTLLSGAGTSGPVLASSAAKFNPASSYEYASFNSVKLTVGQSYTVLIGAPGNGWLVDWNQNNVPPFSDYAGGEAIFEGHLVPYADLTFDIEPGLAPVPETATAWPLLALVGVLLVHRLNFGKSPSRVQT